MNTIKTIKKYLTTDGLEFLNLDSAIEHQKNIELLGGQVKVGSKVTYLYDGYISHSRKVTEVSLPLIYFGESDAIYIPKTTILRVE